mmetsp:Transcript_55029/g.128730  ORF Transcript_55029/g.128730 Transcript_55029/m.128730 type:complete len:331 (+) Transcript_55029:212-1204(+)
MAYYQPQPQHQIRRSYDPPQAQQQSSFASQAPQRAGVGLLFQTSHDGKIVVKEVVQNMSAWRCNLIKPGDVIVKVGHVNVQNQPLANLRELILGEPGTYVTLGFSRGAAGQFYEAKMMRGTADYLDKHMPRQQQQAPAPEPPQQQQQAPPPPQQQSYQPRPAPTSVQSTSNANPSLSSMPSSIPSSIPSSLPASSVGTSSAREQDEIERLRSALSASQAEVGRLRANLRSQELLVERNGEELRTYREALEKRDEENRQGRVDEDRSRQEVLSDFKRKFDRERVRLTQALEKSNSVSRSLNSILPTIQAIERDLQGVPGKPAAPQGSYYTS